MTGCIEVLEFFKYPRLFATPVLILLECGARSR